MVTDLQMAAETPDWVFVSDMLKATPHETGGRRFVYFEASNEGVDQQNEVVLAKALAESSDYYLRYGNVDIDHITMVGARAGIPDYQLYEVGRPVEVGQRDGSTFVKSELYRGEGPAAARANMVWAGMTQVSPPQRWYPSVGGNVLQKSVEVDERTQARRSVVARVRWANVGLSKTPVNQHVSTATTVPVGVFAKCMSAGVLDLTMMKTLTAGYGTDSAALVGGEALRGQSLDGVIKETDVTNYFDFRERFAKALTSGDVGLRTHGVSDLVAFSAEKFGLSRDEAADYVGRFMRDLKAGLQKRKAS